MPFRVISCNVLLFNYHYAILVNQQLREFNKQVQIYSICGSSEKSSDRFCSLLFPLQQPLVSMGLEESMSPRSCSITWHSFSPWHNLSKLSSVHGLPKELLLVVKVVQVVFYVSTSNHSIFRKNLIVEHQKCKCCLLKHQLYDACTKRDEGATAMVPHNIMNAERLHKAACWRYSLVDDKAT